MNTSGIKCISNIEKSWRAHRVTPIMRWLESLRARGSSGSSIKLHNELMSAFRIERRGSFLKLDRDPGVGRLDQIIQMDSLGYRTRASQSHFRAEKGARSRTTSDKTPLSKWRKRNGVHLAMDLIYCVEAGTGVVSLGDPAERPQCTNVDNVATHRLCLC